MLADFKFLSQLQYVDSLLKQKILEQEGVMKQPRRACTLPNYPKGNQNILGKVSFLTGSLLNEFYWFQKAVMMKNYPMTTSSNRAINRGIKRLSEVAGLL